jgi:two-component system cell cycle sensor histidine kinase/response regulator CckA
MLSSVVWLAAFAVENLELFERERKTEEQIRQSQKMDAIGNLAGGIAHDFNNLLTAINGYSALALRKADDETVVRRNLTEIKKAGDRAAALTRQLLAFSRKQVLQPKVLQLNAVVAEIHNMLKRLIGEDIDLVTMLDPALGQAKADPGQIEQVLMNLSVNARDAMPKGGKLTIETANVQLDEKYARAHESVQPGAYVMIAVSDTGCGMDSQTKDRIYEPFFTTKEVGKGTGLGLSTVYGIVNQSGGHIWVYSEEQVGTTFKIYLPRVVEQPQAVGEEEETIPFQTGTETILVVEDEEIVRELTTQILTECGYTVLKARNGVEALAICEKGDCEIDLLMTDVVMPLMGGRELSEKLFAKMPELRILFTSGYTDDAVVRHGVIETGTNFIQKPFVPDALARKVRRILDTTKIKIL